MCATAIIDAQTTRETRPASNAAVGTGEVKVGRGMIPEEGCRTTSELLTATDAFRNFTAAKNTTGFRKIKVKFAIRANIDTVE